MTASVLIGGERATSSSTWMATSALRTGGGSCLTSCLMELGCCCCWEVRGRSAVVFFFLLPRDDDVDGCWEAVSTTSSSSLAQCVETVGRKPEASHTLSSSGSESESSLGGRRS